MSSDRALALLRSANQQIRAAHEEEALLQGICRTAVETGGYRLAWIGHPEPAPERWIRPLAWSGSGSDYLGQVRITWGDDRLGQGPAGQAVRTGRPAVIQDVHTDTRFEPWRGAAREQGFNSTIALPLLHEQTVQGLILVYAAEGAAFDSEEISLLEELAWHLSFALTALRTKEAEAERRAELALQSQQQVILKRILMIALGKRPLEDKLHEVLQQLARLPWFPSEQGAGLFLTDPETGTLTLTAEYNMPAQVRDACATIPLGACYCGRVAETGQIEFARHVNEDHTFQSPDMDDHGHLSLPIPGSDPEPLGTLTLYLEAGHAYSQEEEQFLTTVVTMVGHMVERDRARAADQEQRRRQGDVRRLVTLGEVGSTLAHQLRQPLTAAANYIGIAQQRLETSGSTDGDLGQLLEHTHAQIRRMDDIARNIRSYLGYGVPKLEACDLNRILGDLESLLLEIIPAIGPYRVELDLEPDLDPVPCDPVLLPEVFLNLARNGAEAMAEAGRERGRIRIWTRRADRGIEAGVRDWGPGLPEAQQDELVQPFFTTKTEGMGLGLAVSQSILEMHGGQLWAETPATGPGADIRLFLPRSQEGDDH